VGTIVKAALARGAAPQPTDEEDPVALARQALVQAGFSSATATQAVERATAHVGTAVELGELIKQALRWCA
jgi:Holliday junction resolvasome RuvABC DNA-binding subunit